MVLLGCTAAALIFGLQSLPHIINEIIYLNIDSNIQDQQTCCNHFLNTIYFQEYKIFVPFFVIGCRVSVSPTLTL